MRRTPECGAGRVLFRPEPEWDEPCSRETSHLIIVTHDDLKPFKQQSVALCCFHYHMIPDEIFATEEFDPSLN